MIRTRLRPRTVSFAIVALSAAACGGDRSDRASGDAPAVVDSAWFPASAADTPVGDTGAAASSDAAPAAAAAPTQPGPVTAPQDRATAPTAAPTAGVEAAPPRIAPESATLVPPTVAAAPPPPSEEPRSAPTPVRPFAAGERLTYEVRFGPVRVGTATMEVLGVETVRGIAAYHTRFEVRGGNRLYRVHDRYESWFDTRTLSSLRYVQDIDQGDYERRSTFEIFPDEQRYVETGKEPQPSVAQPLDEGSFIYWLRTIPLEVGRTYTFERYFRPDRNPVRIEVLRRERVRVPAGEFEAIVVRPSIKTRGIFSEGGRAEIWFADDSTRRILQMKSRLSFGSLNLYLR